MNMNYSYPTTICESFFALMLKKLVDKYIFSNFRLLIFHGKHKKNVHNTRNTNIMAKILSYIL